MRDNYENFLIREQTEGPVRWCSRCERDADDCVCSNICHDCERLISQCACESLCDFLREVNSDTADVCVHGPAVVSEPAQWELDALKEIDAI